MANFDEVFKEITGKYPYALAALVLKTSEVKVGDSLNTEHITVRVHHSDMTFHIELPDEDAILHIEAQTDDSRQRPMPLRMLAYSSVLSLEHKKNVYSTVLYFRPPAGQRDPGVYRYGNREQGGVEFWYNVIRMYELEGEAFLDPEALGLLPFTALMKPPADLTAEAWIERCVQTTQQASVDKETRGTLLFALSLFGSLVHPLELFQNPITEAIMQESPFYEHVLQQGVEQGVEQGKAEGRLEGKAEGRLEGKAEGRLEGKREAVLRLLDSQFQNVPEPIRQRITALNSISALDTLFDQAMTAKSLDDLQI